MNSRGWHARAGERPREGGGRARNGTRRYVSGVSRGNVISRYVAIGEASPHGMAAAFCHTAGRELALSTRAESVKRRESSEHVVVRLSFFIPSFHLPLPLFSASPRCNRLQPSLLVSYPSRLSSHVPMDSSLFILPPFLPPSSLSLLLSDSFARFIFCTFSSFPAQLLSAPSISPADFRSRSFSFLHFLYDSFTFSPPLFFTT